VIYTIELHRLKDYRDRLLVSRADLAGRSGVCPKSIYRAEQGRPVKLHVARKIIAGLGLSLDEARSKRIIQ
jgi:DNA-binding XRE family transcriptional regulator